MWVVNPMPPAAANAETMITNTFTLILLYRKYAGFNKPRIEGEGEILS
jgi:hypothetical protein